MPAAQERDLMGLFINGMDLLSHPPLDRQRDLPSEMGAISRSWRRNLSYDPRTLPRVPIPRESFYGPQTSPSASSEGLKRKRDEFIGDKRYGSSVCSGAPIPIKRPRTSPFIGYLPSPGPSPPKPAKTSIPPRLGRGPQSLCSPRGRLRPYNVKFKLDRHVQSSALSHSPGKRNGDALGRATVEQPGDLKVKLMAVVTQHLSPPPSPFLQSRQVTEASTRGASDHPSGAVERTAPGIVRDTPLPRPPTQTSTLPSRPPSPLSNSTFAPSEHANPTETQPLLTTQHEPNIAPTFPPAPEVPATVDLSTQEVVHGHHDASRPRSASAPTSVPAEVPECEEPPSPDRDRERDSMSPLSDVDESLFTPSNTPPPSTPARTSSPNSPIDSMDEDERESASEGEKASDNSEASEGAEVSAEEHIRPRRTTPIVPEKRVRGTASRLIIRVNKCALEGIIGRSRRKKNLPRAVRLGVKNNW